MAQASFEHAVAYAKERRQWGKLIGEHQMIQEMITDMAASIDTARLLAYRALSLLQQGKRCDREASMAKYYATEMAIDVTSKAIQIHGANGLSEEYPVERIFRDARMFTIPDGTTQIQKLIVARDILGLSAFR
jgi:alkylation response protein AidB-like acyl-CoA dehydrogenase